MELPNDQGDGHSCLSFGEAESRLGQAFGLRQAGMPAPLVLLFVCWLALIGCKQDDAFTTGGGHASPITNADITYNELAERYNEQLEVLSSLWARTDVVIVWREDGGGVRREQGEGKLMLRRPHESEFETAFLVEKLGRTYLWAGSNKEQYWLFDLVDGDNKTAYVGALDKLDAPGRRAFPLPVRPEVMPALLGLTPLPIQSSAGQSGASVSMYNGQYLVVTPGEDMRLLIDPETFRPTRVDLNNAEGFSVLTAKLEGSFGVEVPGVRKTRWPSICERLEVHVSGYESRLTIAMDEATNNPNKLLDTMFDFEMLKRGMRPAQIIDLDGR